MDEVFEKFEEAVEALQAASPQNNAKGNALKSWATKYFNETLRVSIVNEAKQAGNRVKEQLSQRTAQHVFFLVTDDDALQPLVRNVRKLAYPELLTAFFASAGASSGQVIPRLLIRNEKNPGALEGFYREYFPGIQMATFGVEAEGLVALHVGEEEAPYASSVNEEVEIVMSSLSVEDPTLLLVSSLLSDGYAGVILSGPPGTGKSWYARELALSISGGRTANVLSIQFHPGYQYEDFMEAYSPNKTGGFELEDRIFLKACEACSVHPDQKFVLVIDEFSRTDVVRVFGEALTYIEAEKRNINFTLSSGRLRSIPSNLILICTMNPWDRGADELDVALERRFAKIDFGPDLAKLKEGLASSQLSESRRQRVEQFFTILARHPNKLCRIGHGYFVRAGTEDSLRRLWDHQLRFHFEKVLRNDDEQLKAIQTAWARVFEG